MAFTSPCPAQARLPRSFSTSWGYLLVSVASRPHWDVRATSTPSGVAYTRSEFKSSWSSLDALEWVLSNIFSLPELIRLFRARPELSSLLPESTPDLLRRTAEQLAGGDQIEAALEDELEEWFDRRMAPLRRADRHFWRSVIDSLRQLRARGELMPEGVPV